MPGQNNPGAGSDALVEFVDIYPTLCELCGLAQPDTLEGVSLVPVLNAPARPGKSAAFSQYPRNWKGQSLMGYSMRTDRYRYTEWLPRDGGPPAGRELYDHQVDPGENVNIVDQPDNKDLVTRLHEQLHAPRQALAPMQGEQPGT